MDEGLGLYSTWQIQLIRQELKKVYKATKSCSWDGLAKFIDSFFYRFSSRDDAIIPEVFMYLEYIPLGIQNVNRPGNKLRNFANGKHELGQSNLAVLAYWLMDDDTFGSSLTSEKLFSLPQKPKLAVLLSEFLHENVDHSPFLSIETLQGEYDFKKDGKVYKLSLHSPANKHVLAVGIEEIFPTADIHDNEDFIDSSNFTHTGWLTIAPNNGLFCFINDNHMNSNEFFIPVAVDDGLFKKNTLIEGLIFLKQIDVAYPHLSKMKNEQTLLDSWMGSNTVNVLKLQRVKKEACTMKTNAAIGILRE